MMSTTRSIGVVVVDDQEPYRAVLRLAVEMMDGFELVGEADSGEAGIDLVDELRPDLVLMDVKMPGIDGLEATRRIVSMWPDTVVVVLSTYHADEFEALALDAGAAAFISKADFGSDTLATIARIWHP
ncbi:MAG: response regulator transcription factor [Acidimicrobiia bacterium]|nr:response regulator transcription factor [Acidimicrobiia bacterium]